MKRVCKHLCVIALCGLSRLLPTVALVLPASQALACSLIGNEPFRAQTTHGVSDKRFDSPVVRLSALQIPAIVDLGGSCGYVGLLSITVSQQNGRRYPKNIGVLVEYLHGRVPENLKAALGRAERGVRTEKGAIELHYWWGLRGEDLEPIDFTVRVSVLNPSGKQGVPSELRIVSEQKAEMSTTPSL